MLVLSRKGGESIRIGDDIIVTVLGDSTAQVRIGIEAPRHVPVNREEVHQRNRLREAAEAGSRVENDGAE